MIAQCSRPIILIPAYKPSVELHLLVLELLLADAIQAIVIVNDGSGPKSEELFQKLSHLNGIHVLTHAINLGKGAALKTGLNFIAHQFPNCQGVVTADADGQHAANDILKMAEELQRGNKDLVLGSRSFEGTVPFRSKFGNLLTRKIFAFFSGQKLLDTQTGLRGIPADLISACANLRQNGYDYELEMLLMMQNFKKKIREIHISTIYIDQNKSSHFRPLMDSLRIYSLFFRFAAVSLLSALLDNSIFIVVFMLTQNILASQGVGRAISLSFNYFANKKSVFHSQAKTITSMPHYLGLALFLMVGSYITIELLESYWHLHILLAKIGAESIFFVLSFIVQKLWVFKAANKTAMYEPVIARAKQS